MTVGTNREAVVELCSGRVLKVIIFDAASVRELGRLERRYSKRAWPRFEALAQRLADYGRIHNETAFRHEFDVIYAIKAKHIRAFGVFDDWLDDQRYFVIFRALKKNKGKLSKHEVASIRQRRSMFDEWRKQQDGQEILKDKGSQP